MLEKHFFFIFLTYNKWKFIPFSWTRMCKPKRSDEMNIFFVDIHNWSYYCSIKSLIMNHPTRCSCSMVVVFMVYIWSVRYIALHFTISNNIFHSFLLLPICLLLTQLCPYSRIEQKYLKQKKYTEQWSHKHTSIHTYV